jgi:hypothetical protein
VAILNPSHLFDQALTLATSETGRPRQADIRRAISACYYGLFHAVMTAAADLVIGPNYRTEPRYGLAYRHIDHGRLRKVCDDIQKQTIPDRYKSFSPKGGFGTDLRAFATAVIELQEKRLAADYDPMSLVKQSDAILLVATARAALARFQSTDADERATFLTLLLFEPRK